MGQEDQLSKPKQGSVRGGDPGVRTQVELSVRACLVGALGSAVITTSSMYVALKLGALPWPIVFVALCSLMVLKRLGNTNMGEINVAHTAMSAGAMIAGGVAFTIPGMWIIDPGAEVPFIPLLLAVLCATVLGLIFSALIRKHFVITHKLVYPMGHAAAQTLVVADKGGSKAGILFGSLGISAFLVILRDVFHLIPVKLFSKAEAFGVHLSIHFSPMMMAMGYLVGLKNIAVWFLGALIGHGLLIAVLPNLSLISLEYAAMFKSSLGIGIMLGCGVGVLIKHVLPRAAELFAPLYKKGAQDNSIISLRWAPWSALVMLVLFTVVLDFSLLTSILCIIGAWIAVIMAAQSVGDTGVDPLEVFAVIMLLLARFLVPLVGLQAFFFVCIIAVACGLAGDVMSDFKAGEILQTSPRAQWIGQVFGALVGAVVSVAVLYILMRAFGTNSFGEGKEFIAVQASVVASLIGGQAYLPSLFLGLAIGCLLYIVKFPVMTLGLGVYLPLHLTLAACLGGLIRFVIEYLFPLLKRCADKDKALQHKDALRTDELGALQEESHHERSGTDGVIIASGMLGGEALVSVIIAFASVFFGLGH